MRNTKLLKMTQVALLGAIIFILTYFPLKIGPIEMTLRMIPCVIGAIILGPLCGALLGGIFGLTSFCECIGLFGFPLSAFGQLVLSINPFYTVVMCIVPRVLMGLLCGFIFKAFKKAAGEKRPGIAGYIVTNVSGALLNTILFMATLILFFWSNAKFMDTISGWGVSTKNVWTFLVAFVGINGLVEALVCAFIGTGVSKGVDFALSKRKVK